MLATSTCWTRVYSWQDEVQWEGREEATQRQQGGWGQHEDGTAFLMRSLITSELLLTRRELDQEFTSTPEKHINARQSSRGKHAN